MSDPRTTRIQPLHICRYTGKLCWSCADPWNLRSIEERATHATEAMPKKSVRTVLLESSPHRNSTKNYRTSVATQPKYLPLSGANPRVDIAWRYRSPISIFAVLLHSSRRRIDLSHYHPAYTIVLLRTVPLQDFIP